MARKDVRMIVAPPEWWEAAEDAAKDANAGSLSAWVTQLIHDALRPEVRKSLPDRKKPGRPPTPVPEVATKPATKAKKSRAKPAKT